VYCFIDITVEAYTWNCSYGCHYSNKSRVLSYCIILNWIRLSNSVLYVIISSTHFYQIDLPFICGESLLCSNFTGLDQFFLDALKKWICPKFVANQSFWHTSLTLFCTDVIEFLFEQNVMKRRLYFKMSFPFKVLCASFTRITIAFLNVWDKSITPLFGW
jgi:hypothetical protein